MRKALIFGLAGVFLSTAAWAGCGGAHQTTAAGSNQQTVMTGQGGSGGQSVKPDGGKS